MKFNSMGKGLIFRAGWKTEASSVFSEALFSFSNRPLQGKQ